MINKTDPIENPMENVQSYDWNAERLGQLKQLMPDLFSNDGKLNINELKKAVAPKSVNETERGFFDEDIFDQAENFKKRTNKR